MEVGDFFHFAKIVPVGLTESEYGAAGAKGLFPEVRGGSGFGRKIDHDGFAGFLSLYA